LAVSINYLNVRLCALSISKRVKSLFPNFYARASLDIQFRRKFHNYGPNYFDGGNFIISPMKYAYQHVNSNDTLQRSKNKIEPVF
jgi:hypothetical protein